MYVYVEWSYIIVHLVARSTALAAAHSINSSWTEAKGTQSSLVYKVEIFY
jgi:hypothetical protein